MVEICYTPPYFLPQMSTFNKCQRKEKNRWQFVKGLKPEEHLEQIWKICLKKGLWMVCKVERGVFSFQCSQKKKVVSSWVHFGISAQIHRLEIAQRLSRNNSNFFLSLSEWKILGKLIMMTKVMSMTTLFWFDPPFLIGHPPPPLA